MCRGPVGLGANLTLITESGIRKVFANIPKIGGSSNQGDYAGRVKTEVRIPVWHKVNGEPGMILLLFPCC